MKNIIAVFLFMGGINLAAADPTVTGSPPILPNNTLTPGVVNKGATKDMICTPGYSSSVRHVTQKTKDFVYKQYGIVYHQPGDYEIDHLISLELGGSNDQKNLWPQSYKTQPWNAHVKDKLENKLHDMVCDGELELQDAQDMIAKDWVGAYCKIFNANCNGDNAP